MRRAKVPASMMLKARSLLVLAWAAFSGATLLGWAGLASARAPLPHEQAQGLYQRVLTLPGAVLHRSADGAPLAGDPPPVFSIYYVFDRRGSGDTQWLEVGADPNGETLGWLPVEFTQDWSLMLVMQYAPPGQRRRVLFFEDRDGLWDTIEAPDPAPLVSRLVSDADAGRATDPLLLSIEPTDQEGSVTFEASPYLMPIVDHQRAYFDDGTPATMVRIASVSANPPAEEPEEEIPYEELKIGVVFVFDTTISMEPFIKLTHRAVERIYGALERGGHLDQTSFGLVGFRNNMDRKPQLEYVYRIYQDLVPGARPETILSSVRQVHEADVSTHSFDEDAVAGLYTAIRRLNWQPFKAKFIVFVTDAGALPGSDPLAHYRDVDIFNVKEAANHDKIAIFPIHLQSGVAKRLRNINKARSQYMVLGRTGDANASKYIPVPGASEREFDQRLAEVERALLDGVQRLAEGRPIERTEVPKTGRPDLERLIINELFNAQQRYIGALKGTDAPTVFNAWASDKDLVNPQYNALKVSVFLSRNQLSELGLALGRIVRNAKEANISGDSFFSLLQSLAAATATDPTRFGARFQTIGESDLLPSYLRLLPYKSKVLTLKGSDWRDLGKSRQDALIGELVHKQKAYHDFYEDKDNWKDLGAGDPAQEVYPLPLTYLP